MTQINANEGDKLELNINNADNRVIAYLNSEQVYSKSTEGDPSFNDIIDVGSRLHKGQNSLVIIGINRGGPFHFKGKLDLNNNPVGVWDEHGEGNTLGFISDWCYLIRQP